MNDQQRAAMQMALEALEDLVNGWKYIRSSYGDLYGVGWDRAEGKGDTAITALREALAQPQEQSQVTTEYQKGWIDGLREFLTRLQDSYNHYWQTRPIALSEFDNGYLAAHGTATRAVQYMIDKATNTAPDAQQAVTECNAGEVRSTDTGEWNDLTDDEILTSANVSQDDIDDLDLSNVLSDVRAVIAKFKEKNTPPVVPQGEPVYAFRRKGLDDFCTCDERRYLELSDKPNLFETTIFYTTPPSVEAMRLETLEKAAQVCEQRDIECHEYFGADCAAAIRGMK